MTVLLVVALVLLVVGGAMFVAGVRSVMRRSRSRPLESQERVSERHLF